MDAARTTTKCLRCGRNLRCAKSVSAGYGRTCKAKIAAAAKAVDAKPAQVAKAIELVEVGGIVPIRSLRHGGRAFRAVSSNGIDTYLTAANACGCPAGLKGRTCYHTLAAQLIDAA